jgi:uncharacterized membrane protein YbhN (UPF0104 family)
VSVLVILALALATMVAMVLFLVSRTQHAVLKAVLSRFAVANRFRSGILEVSARLADFGRHDRRRQLRFLALSIVRNAFAVTALISFARAVGVSAPLADLGWVRSVIDLLLILPISIAGVGVRDASLVALLAPLGVPSSTALALSFLLLGVTLMIAITGGLVEALRVFYGVAPGLRGRTM